MILARTKAEGIRMLQDDAHHTQDDTRSHTRWHTFTYKMIHRMTCSHENGVLFSFMSFQILLFLYVINKQGTVFFNLSQFLSHIMLSSIKHFEFSSVHVNYSMAYTASALLSCFKYWVHFSLRYERHLYVRLMK